MDMDFEANCFFYQNWEKLMNLFYFTGIQL